MKLGLKNSDRTLESFAIFPYVAWAITIIFAGFVYNIAVELQAVAERLEAQAQQQAADTRFE